MADNQPPPGPMVFPPPRNPDDLGRGPLIIGWTWTFTALAVMAATTRIYVRRKDRNLKWDDWLMFLAMLFQIVNQVLVTMSFRYGLGKHDADLQLPDELIQILKWNWLSIAPGVVVTVMARISIAMLLIRLFGVHRWLRIYLICLTVVNVIMGILVLVCTWAQTKPVEAMWEIFLPNIQRWDPRIVLYMMYFGQSTSTLADLSYVVLPVAIIWRLNMAIHQRIGLILVMSVSVLTAVLSVLKTVWAISGSPGGEDVQYRASMTLLWATAEQACVVLLGCVPPLRSSLNLDFSGFKSLSSSLFGGSRYSSGWSKEGSGSGGSGSKLSKSGITMASGAYYDVEMNTHNLGLARPSDSLHKIDGPVVTYDDAASNKSLVADGQVRRTDAFAISYSRPR